MATPAQNEAAQSEAARGDGPRETAAAAATPRTAATPTAATPTAAVPEAARPAASAQDSMAAISAALRRERQRAGLSLSEVARRANVSKSTLSQLESGVGNPSLETLWALCVALDTPFARLFDPPRPRVQLIRAGDGMAIAAAEADYLAVVLATCPPGARRDVYRVQAEPGNDRVSEPHMPGVIEHVVLCAGRALVGLADEPLELGPGDYTAYPGDVAHVFRALEPGTWAVLLSEHS